MTKSKEATTELKGSRRPAWLSMWKLHVAEAPLDSSLATTASDIKSHFFKWRNFPLLSLLSHVVSPAAIAASTYNYEAIAMPWRRRGGGGGFATEAMVLLLGQLLRASSFPGTLAHEEILPHHWVDFSTCNRRAKSSSPQPRPRKAKASSSKACQLWHNHTNS